MSGAFTTTLTWCVYEMSFASISISLLGVFHLIKRGTKHGIASSFNDNEFELVSHQRARKDYCNHAMHRPNGIIPSSFARLKGVDQRSREIGNPVEEVESLGSDQVVN